LAFSNSYLKKIYDTSESNVLFKRVKNSPIWKQVKKTQIFKIVNRKIIAADPDPRIRIGLLVIITNYSCTLQCKDCGNFIPIMPSQAKKPSKIESIKDDIDRLSPYIYCNNLQIQGGEPLLYKNLDELISYIDEKRISKKITLVTNGTLLLQKELLGTLKKFNVDVRISDYNLKQQKISKILAQCEKFGIKTRIHSMGSGDGSWYDLGDISTSKNTNINEVQEIFRSCPFNKCYTISKGQFTKCSRSPVGHEVGLHEFFQDDHVNIREETNLKEALSNFIESPHFMKACQYCHGNKGKVIDAGIQLETK
jgi:organic radical activating enzyme